MPDHTLFSSISCTKIFPEFLLPIEEFTLHQRKKLEGALQLHFTHWDHAEGVCLLQCSEVFFSFPYWVPNHSCLEGKTNHPSHFFSWAFCKAISQMLLHSLSMVPIEPDGTEKILQKMQHLPMWEVETLSQKIKDWELKWRKAPPF